jgi:hypothetical protein
MVSHDERSAPAVLIEDAANSVPWAMIDDNINNAIFDGAELGILIGKRFHASDAGSFNQIPLDSGLIFPFAGSVLVCGHEQLLL